MDTLKGKLRTIFFDHSLSRSQLMERLGRELAQYCAPHRHDPDAMMEALEGWGNVVRELEQEAGRELPWPWR